MEEIESLPEAKVEDLPEKSEAQDDSLQRQSPIEPVVIVEEHDTYNEKL